MRIIVWGINYSPEVTGIAPFNTGLCTYLKRQGHDVQMVTGFPYYPGWKKAAADQRTIFRTDVIKGVPVHRCWLYVPARATTLRRIAHELSFGLFSFVRALTLSAPEVYVIVSPPLLLGPLASLIAWVKRRPYVFHVQDLQPDAALGLGMVKTGVFTRLLYWAEGWSYMRATAVSGISRGMVEAFARKGVAPEKTWLFPNWIRSETDNRDPIEDAVAGDRFREKYAIPFGAFLVSYSGNLGRKQGLETLVEAAKQVQRVAVNRGPGENASGSCAVLILIVGDGSERESLARQVKDAALTNVRMLPLLDDADYRGLLAASDIGVILQLPGSGQYFLPSKLLSMLRSGLAILGASDSDSALAKAIEEGKFGLNVAPANAAALANAIIHLADRPELLERFRRNANWVERFSESRVLGELLSRLRLLTGNQS